ncbi:cobalt/nickel transport system ATP-binding protein [Hydrogenothermus marinus]|uniref:Cobalt/nickel transport system ATP-binding protein n=1 Tax=Hydrogenothermus marinus TaxID=133270 RepID=A0A3M0BMT6_9AQUI|nr:cobalt/nickel transport system ATP-binding protein [Hydrogenothermus marinus]
MPLNQEDFLIKCNNLTYYFENSIALNNISFSVKKGERLVLLGANGSGKTTLLRILAALYFPHKGELIYKGNIINRKTSKDVLKQLRTEIGILFQNPDTMIFNPTVYDEIAFGLQERDYKNIKDKVYEVAKLCQIEHLLDRSPLKLSGGEKQKVALASILAPNPEVLLLDEPTANLDPGSTGWLIDLLYELDITLIISTHNLSIAPEFASRALVLDTSHNLIFDGSLKELKNEYEILKKANLVHKHKYRNDFHWHDWY